MPTRFFTPLRCVQNDMSGALRCVQNDMWGARRCVQNDMWGALRCVQNDMLGARLGSLGGHVGGATLEGGID